MSVRAILVVLLAGICGISAAVGMNQLRRPTPAEKEVETTPVLVAAVDIARGRNVTADDVEVIDWPKVAELPEGALTKVEDAVGRAAMYPICVGDSVLEGKLAPKDAGIGLAALIPKGMRAYTIEASNVTSQVAGFILPGNRVDVLMNVTGRPDGPAGGGSTTTLLQSVEILAVDQNVDAPADNKVDPKDLRSVTLVVTPDQANKLDVGQKQGKLTLSLRNPEDIADAQPHAATLADIRYHQEGPLEMPQAEDLPPVEPKEEKPEVYQIRTLRGSQRGEVWIDAGG